MTMKSTANLAGRSSNNSPESLYAFIGDSPESYEHLIVNLIKAYRLCVENRSIGSLEGVSDHRPLPVLEEEEQRLVDCWEDSEGYGLYWSEPTINARIS